MSLQKIKIGILGCAGIAEKAVIPALMGNDRFELVAVASRDPQKANRFAERYHCRACSYDELLKETIDAIYIPLPVGLHYEWGKKVLEAGKHLLMEKVFVDSLSKAENLISLAKERHLICMEALMYTYHPLFKKVKELVRNGEIGELRSVEAQFGVPEFPAENIRNHRDIGGGAILDNLIYPLSLSLAITKEKLEGFDFKFITHSGYKTDLRGFLFLKFPSTVAQISYGFGFMYRNCYLIWGSTGYLVCDRVYSRPADFSNPIKLFKQTDVVDFPIEKADQFSLMLDAFYNKVLGHDDSGENEGNDILERMSIISRLYEAAL